MRKFKISSLVIIVLTVLCTAYSCKPTPREILWQKTEDFIIVDINPPKHFYINPQNTQIFSLCDTNIQKNN